MVKHAHNFIDITGNVYNNLKVICWDPDPPKEENTGHYSGLWKCKCLLCGGYTWAKKDQLDRGNRKACHKCASKNKALKKKENKYDLSGSFGIGWTYNTNNMFLFDKEDFDLIKDYSWKETKQHFVKAIKNNKDVFLHRLVMNVTDKNIHIDHIQHNRLDNRKVMLRKASCHQNTMNKVLAVNNRSGTTGVCWEKESNKWHSYIWFNGKTIHLGRFENKEDAIQARIEAEDKYFGEFSIHNSMRRIDNE